MLIQHVIVERLHNSYTLQVMMGNARWKIITYCIFNHLTVLLLWRCRIQELLGILIVIQLESLLGTKMESKVLGQWSNLIYAPGLHMFGNFIYNLYFF